MNEINKINLSEQTKSQLSETIEIENYFHQEINQRNSYSKKSSNYITAFDYIDKILIVLSATTGGVSIICKFCWCSCGNSKCEFYSNCFSNNRNS